MSNTLQYIGFLLLILAFSSCSFSQEYKTVKSENNDNETKEIDNTYQIIDQSGTTLQTRINPPKGYTRVAAETNSFANYLRNLPLKPDGTLVQYYSGEYKPNYNTYVAVVDLPIGTKDLHQCADAVMRLRAEYLYSEKQYDKIHFNFTNGFRVDYTKWAQGQRIAIQGNKTWWVDRAKPSYEYDSFWKYLETIFSYAGSYSLSKELIPIKYEELQIGDVFMLGGSPGHCVIVVDMAVDQWGDKIYMLAQSYMPAQEIQILTNPNNSDLSPWYILNATDTDIYTPEWKFTSDQVMRFGE